MKRKVLFYLIPILVLGIVIMLISVFKKDKESFIVNVKVSVNYIADEKKIVVENIDSVDFVHAEVVIDSYYKLRDINLVAGESYSIWQVEFVHHNGMHYPLKYNPRIFSIWCELNDGRKGFYSKKIK
jgi:hypothetical protein